MRAFRSGLIQREKVVQLATPIIMSLMAFHSRSRRGEKSAWRERFGYHLGQRDKFDIDYDIFIKSISSFR